MWRTETPTKINNIMTYSLKLLLITLLSSIISLAIYAQSEGGVIIYADIDAAPGSTIVVGDDNGEQNGTQISYVATVGLEFHRNPTRGIWLGTELAWIHIPGSRRWPFPNNPNCLTCGQESLARTNLNDINVASTHALALELTMGWNFLKDQPSLFLGTGFQWDEGGIYEIDNLEGEVRVANNVSPNLTYGVAYERFITSLKTSPKLAISVRAELRGLTTFHDETEIQGLEERDPTGFNPLLTTQYNVVEGGIRTLLFPTVGLSFRF